MKIAITTQNIVKITKIRTLHYTYLCCFKFKKKRPIKMQHGCTNHHYMMKFYFEIAPLFQIRQIYFKNYVYKYTIKMKRSS